MAITRDTIASQIPGHILESYPRFCDFLEAYYEWLHQEGNPYERVKYHMDYLDFQKSLDAYVELMKNEYLHDVPESVLIDKELFIKWSKKFNLARGSHASYKFLFKLLFDEQTTDIYLPKENILKTSDGVWVSGESRMILTNTAPLSDFTFQILEQEREIGAGEFEYAYATIQSARRCYGGRYDVIELRVTDIQGTFYKDWPVKTELGGEAWLIDTIQTVNIVDGGENHTSGERIVFDNIGEYIINHPIETSGEYDTRVTTHFVKDDIKILVNSSFITDFEYDGRRITSTAFSIGDDIEVRLPAFSGYFSVGETDFSGSVIEVDILEAPIGTYQSTYAMSNDGYGTGLVGEAVSGLYSEVNGYYKGTYGHLSSNMYLQDSFFYQNYSYAIQTMQDIASYRDIVKDVLHPSGFQMFGIINIINVIEMIIELIQSSEEVLPFELYSINKYSLGPNYSFFDRFKAGLSKRLYRLCHFRDTWDEIYYFDPDDDLIEEVNDYVAIEYPVRFRYDPAQMVGDDFIYMEDNIVINTSDYVEEVNYCFEDQSLSKTYIDEKLYYGKDKGYYPKNTPYPVLLNGWMTKYNMVDYHLFLPQGYSSEVESGYQYFETGYVTERTA